jgi:hypothetical protein
MLVNEIIWSAALPLVTAAATMAIAGWWRLRPRAVWALAIGLAYVIAGTAFTSRAIGFVNALGKLLRPLEAQDWLPPAVLMAMGITLLAVAAPRTWQRWIVALAAAMCLAVPLRLVSGNIAATWPAAEKLGVLAAIATVLALVWLLLSTPRREQPTVRAILLVVVAAAMAAVLTKSGSLVLGRQCGLVAAALVGATLTSSRSGVGRFYRAGLALDLGIPGAAGALTMSLGGLLIVAHFYAEFSTTNLALLTASLAAAGGRLPTVLATGSAWYRAMVRAALCLIPLAIVVANTFAPPIATS